MDATIRVENLEVKSEEIAQTRFKQKFSASFLVNR